MTEEHVSTNDFPDTEQHSAPSDAEPTLPKRPADENDLKNYYRAPQSRLRQRHTPNPKGNRR